MNVLDEYLEARKDKVFIPIYEERPRWINCGHGHGYMSTEEVYIGEIEVIKKDK